MAIDRSETKFTYCFSRAMMCPMKKPGSMIARKKSEMTTPEKELSMR